VAVCVLAVGGVWMVLDPAHPSLKPPSSDKATRKLAYERAIAEPHKQPQAEKHDAATQPPEIPPFQTVTTPSEPSDESQASTPDSTANQIGTADQTAVPNLPAEGANAAQDTQDRASLPEDVTPRGTSSQDAAPEQPIPYGDVSPITGEAGQGASQGGANGAADEQGRREEPWSDGDAHQQGNGGYQDDNGYQQGNQPPDGNGYPEGNRSLDGNNYPAHDQASNRDATEWADQNTEQWVQVIISGAAMRATAADDAPMLFAFPYGRNLKVVSRYEGWVEVTDPQSAATGWMKAYELAPSAAGPPNGQAYYDPPPPQPRGGFFRQGGFADMISRALGGAF
jgi:hypothetical protein